MLKQYEIVIEFLNNQLIYNMISEIKSGDKQSDFSKGIDYGFVLAIAKIYLHFDGIKKHDEVLSEYKAMIK